MQEIERKFTAGFDPVLETRIREEGIRILQVYLRTDPMDEVRLRRRTTPSGIQAWVLTQKRGSGLVREEAETSISAQAAAVLESFAPFPAPRLEKIRLRLGGWELDLYPNGGLRIAEAELETPESPLPELPAGLTLLEEVTGKREYSNVQIALDGRETGADNPGR
jgi:CYTH domain-containing protein